MGDLEGGYRSKSCISKKFDIPFTLYFGDSLNFRNLILILTMNELKKSISLYTPLKFEETNTLFSFLRTIL